MTDAEAEAMLAECRAVLPGLVWRLGSLPVAIGEDANSVTCAEVLRVWPDESEPFRACVYALGFTLSRHGATATEALAKARGAAGHELAKRQAELDRERAWLGLSNG